MNLFRISMPVCALVGILGILFPTELASAVQTMTGAVFSRFDWLFLWSITAFLVLCVAFAISPIGRIKLGGADETPEFSTPAWLAMLFAAGMGSGLMFWGVAEPMTHFAAPPYAQPDTVAAMRNAMTITNFHWGLHAWACYAIGALVLAYFKFKRGTSFQPGAPLRSAFAGVWVEPVARFADFTAVMAVAFGVCGSMAMASLQFQSGLGVVSGWDTTGMGVRAAILIVLFICYSISASTSLDKGIKILSQTNIALAIGLALFLLFIGPTTDLLSSFATAAGDYLAALPSLAIETHGPAQKGWFHGWTIIYFIWWISWTPFVGIFIARISKGRTIRQFLGGVVLAPTAFTIIWFAVFGGVGLAEDAASGGAVATAVKQDAAVALFQLFERLPGATILGGLSLVLVFVFLVTSVDSATYVLGMLTSKGVPDPPTVRKLAWGVALALMGGALLFIGNVDLIKALSTVGAIPFVPILLLQVAALLIALRRDRRAGSSHD